MAYGAWRGMVGTVKPTKGSGSLEELIRMLPDGIGVIPLFNNIRHGTIGEFSGVLPSYEEKIAELAGDKVDVIHPAGTPPFMLLGYRKEQELIARMGEEIRRPDLHLRQQPGARAEGAWREEVRRHRLRLRGHEHRRSLLHRCGLQGAGTGAPAGTMGGHRDSSPRAKSTG